MNDMDDILVCKCGWWGYIENQDALGSECGCCPDCGNEDLIWLSKLLERIQELEAEIVRLKTQMLPNEYEQTAIEAMDEGKAIDLRIMKGK